jgi:hypothetical protein
MFATKGLLRRFVTIVGESFDLFLFRPNVNLDLSIGHVDPRYAPSQALGGN